MGASDVEQERRKEGLPGLPSRKRVSATAENARLSQRAQGEGDGRKKGVDPPPQKPTWSEGAQGET